MNRKRAFTIIEMLVVITIIGLLLGLLVPALSGVRRKAHKSVEVNNLKQVSYAWMLYGNQNNDAALPGYMEIEVQAPRVQDVSRGWGVKYEFPDHTPIPPAPGYLSSDDNIAGPWTWRLMPFLDYAHDVVHGYSDDHESSLVGIAADLDEALEIAEEPAYGYNGMYIGGYWRMQDVGGVATPRYDFYNHCEVGTGKRLAIPTTIGQIGRASELITFCTTTKIDVTGVVGRLENDVPGTHLAEPSTVGTVQKWALDPALGVVVNEAPAYVPLGRHTGSAVVLYADGHIDQQTHYALMDQRMWIDNASTATAQHQQCP